MCNALHLPLISREQLDVSCRFLAANGKNGDNEADGKSGVAGILHTAYFCFPGWKYGRNRISLVLV